MRSYPLDLTGLQLGSRVGLMRRANGDLHYYLDGVDQGRACSNVLPGQMLALVFVILRLLRPVQNLVECRIPSFSCMSLYFVLVSWCGNC